MARIQFRELARNRVAIKFPDDGSDNAHEEWFSAPTDGGYVRADSGGWAYQPCEAFDRLGPTMLWNGREALVDYLRREWRRGQARDRYQRYFRA